MMSCHVVPVSPQDDPLPVADFPLHSHKETARDDIQKKFITSAGGKQSKRGERDRKRAHVSRQEETKGQSQIQDTFCLLTCVDQKSTLVSGQRLQ
jgi:hypothetical protein